ncbi:MAG TPA: hypothetical protein VGB52_00980 [Actinomycetota bacterium]
MVVRDGISPDSPLFKIMRQIGRERRPRRARRIHVMIDTDLDFALARWAQRENLTKSALIRWVLRSHLPEPLPSHEDPIDAVCGSVAFEPTDPVDLASFYPSLP